MVYSSLPLYHLDPQANWHHQQQLDENQQIVLYHAQQHENNNKNNSICSAQDTAAAPPAGSQSGGDGGGGVVTTGIMKPNSMVDRARQAQVPLPEAGLKCPRCDSTNTKFCYFNNYNLSQPRHFCKMCRRYWTRGGSLRNVPVGGASRRTAKRTKAARPTTTVSGGSTRSLLGSTNSVGSGGGHNNNNNNNNLFLSHNNLPFLPSSHHHFGNSSPNSSNIGLNLVGRGHGGGGGGSEMEFPNLLASFEGLGRMNNQIIHHQIHHPYPFQNSSLGNLINHSLQSKPSSDMDPEVINRMAFSKIEDPTRGVNVGNNNNNHNHHQFNWNTHMWTTNNNNASDLSGFASLPSSNGGHLLG